MAAWFWRMRPLIVTVWGSDTLGLPGRNSGRLTKWSRRAMLGQACHITAASSYLAAAAEKYVRGDVPISIVPFGVDVQLFRPRIGKQTDSRQVKLIVAKHLRWNYGIDYLISALDQIVQQYPRVSLNILGEGIERENLVQQVDRLGLSGHVTFTGRIQHPEIVNYLQQADIAVMPSLAESFGVFALEAQACGLPVVASNVGGVPEAIMQGETGLLVPPADAGALAEAILSLVYDRRLRERMGQKGAEFVRREFSWDDSVRMMDEVYCEVQAGLHG
jgi:L-malate glycosyltransferase